MKNFFDEMEQFFNEFDGFFKFKPIRLIGETKNEKGTDEFGDWVKQTFTSKDGSYQISTFYRTNNKKITNDITVESSDLQKQLDECVKNQEFEKAAELRDKIKSIKENQKHVESLRKQMDEAVKNQEFEKAAQLRDQIKNCQM
jgi:protein-arginine kinase activator protein McsA